jgi:hypothetical protein
MRRLTWKYSGRGEKAIWFGANDLRREGAWNWADGSKLNYRFFEAGEPNNYANREDCAAIAYDQRWNDMVCKAPLRYVCEKRTSV